MHIMMELENKFKIGDKVKVMRWAHGYRVGEILPIRGVGTVCLFLGDNPNAIYHSKVRLYNDFNDYLKELN